MAHKSAEEREKTIFHAARSIEDGAQRELYLAAACTGDLQLRARVDSLLSAADGAGEFLESPLDQRRNEETASTPKNTRSQAPDEKNQEKPTDIAPTVRHGLHIRCPHCHRPIEVVDEDFASDVTCSACGSRFNLIDDKGKSYTSPVLNKIAHFEIIERLGAGAFGTVWKARDTELDRTVAIKVPRGEQLSSNEAERFLKEARAAAQLRHPNIVSVHEVGRQDDTIYIVSDFVRGVTLADWLTGQRPAHHEAARLCKKIAEALHHAHGKGVIHRDLKPQNVMIDGDGEPHIMDFGLAKRDAGEITMTVEGRILGTPAYMSPEQARGEGHNADARSDVYSLGVILFEFLTGEHPFRGNRNMLMHQVLHEEAPSPRKLDSKIPRDLETICLKCLEKEPAKRFASAQEFADELGRFVRGEPIMARPITIVARTWRWCKRKPVVAALTAAVATSLLAGAAVSSYFAIEAVARANDALEQKNRADANATKEATARKDAEREKIRADGNAKKNAEIAEANIKVAKVNAALATQVKAEKEKVERQLLLTRKSRYVMQIGIAQRAIEGNDFAYAEYILGNTAKNLRGWEYHYLRTTLNSRVVTLQGHDRGVLDVAFSPDGQWIASGSIDGRIKIWDATSGEETLTLQGHSLKPGTYESPVISVAFSPDGRRIASSSNLDKTIKVWDASNGEEHTKVWEATSGEETLTFGGHARAFTSVAFSPDGRRIVSGSSDKTVKVWNATSREEILTLKGRTGYVFSVAFSPDGRRIVSGSLDETVKVWDANTGEETFTLKGHTDVVSSVAFSADGKRIVSGSFDNTVKVWDAFTAKEIQTPVTGESKLRKTLGRGHAGSITSVAFSPDGKTLASGSLRTASGSLKTIRLWNVATGKNTTTIDDFSLHLAFSPDGKTLAAGGFDRTIKLWDMASRKNAATLKGHTKRVVSVAFSPDGKTLASGSEDGTIKLWDVGPVKKD